MYTKQFIIDEMSNYTEYDINFLNDQTEDNLIKLFNEHCEKYSLEVKAKDLVENYKNTDFLMSTPDGYLNVGDFWIKHNKSIVTIKTADNYSAKVSTDHLFETPYGWVQAGKLNKGDLILTKDGFREIQYTNTWDNPESVYDWEILHENHRYWAGNGISSHNTGKTFLLLNAIKRAQDDGYSIIFYDSENAVDKDLVKKFGIDTMRFRYEPCNTVQDFRSSVTSLADKLLEQKKKGYDIPRIAIALDSAGNLATLKEITDAKTGSDKADMTRAKLLKSTFRILMTKLGILKIPFIFTNHSYQTQDLFSQTVQGGGCLTPGSLVLMSDGSYKEIENIKEGEFVKTLIGDKEIKHVWEFNKPVIKVDFEDGSSLTCSEDHRFFIGTENDDPTDDKNWVYAKFLKEDDFVSKF